MNYLELPRKNLESLFDNPDFYPIKLELGKGQIYFFKMTAEDFSREAFHDLRLLSEESTIYIATIAQVLNQFKHRLTAPVAQNYIFHTAFCGSTLLSRYLNTIDECLVYREPQVFMEIAHFKHCHPNSSNDGSWKIVLTLIAQLLARTDSTSPPIVKMVDNCNDIVTDLLNLNPASTGLVLYSSLDEFLISILKHPIRRSFARDRLKGINIKKYPALANVDILKLNVATGAACLWLAQMYQILDITGRQQQQFYTLSKADLINRPEESLAAAINLFGLDQSEEVISNALATQGHIHAKSGQAFSTEKRLEHDLALTNTYQDELREGIFWSKSILENKPVPLIMPRALLGIEK